MISDRSIGVNDISNDEKKRPEVSVFSYECIMTATNNFALESKIGEGGFGPVYMVRAKTFLEKARLCLTQA